MRCGQLQPVAGRNGWLDGVRNLWKYDETLLEGTGSKANPGIRNPKAAGPERIRRLIYAFSEGGLALQYEQTSWRLKQIYCPNCRHLVNGYESKDGTTRMICEKCGSVMIRKTMGRRHDRIELYAPRGQEHI